MTARHRSETDSPETSISRKATISFPFKSASQTAADGLASPSSNPRMMLAKRSRW